MLIKPFWVSTLSIPYMGINLQTHQPLWVLTFKHINLYGYQPWQASNFIWISPFMCINLLWVSTFMCINYSIQIKLYVFYDNIQYGDFKLRRKTLHNWIAIVWNSFLAILIFAGYRTLFMNSLRLWIWNYKTNILWVHHPVICMYICV